VYGREGRVAEIVSGAGRSPRRRAPVPAEGHGALIVIERETGLEQMGSTGVMIHGDLSADLLRTIFSPARPLHDGAVIVRGARILARGAVLPLSETPSQSSDSARATVPALGTTEQTDADRWWSSRGERHVSLRSAARLSAT
jgi:diadenylate cyclase